MSPEVGAPPRSAGRAAVRADVVIVGGGPVGLVAALHAARAGLVVVVLEPRGGAVDKACGEGIMPGGVAALAHVGVDPGGWPLAGIRYVSGRHEAVAAFAHGTGRGVRRTTLHSALREAVASAGVEVLPLAADGLDQDDEGVTVHAHPPGRGGRRGHRSRTTVRGAYVLAADGLHSPTRRALGLEVAARGPRRHGQRRHFVLPPWTDHVEVHWARHAEAYVTPVGADLVGVAVLSARHGSFADHLSGFPALERRLGRAGVESTVRGAGPLRQRSAARVAGRVLLVGDASGYVDALTGEGVSLGLTQARAAVAAVAAGRPESYEREWRRTGRRAALLTHALVQGTRPAWARRALVPAAGALPGVFAAAVDALGRPS